MNVGMMMVFASYGWDNCFDAIGHWDRLAAVQGVRLMSRQSRNLKHY